MRMKSYLDLMTITWINQGKHHIIKLFTQNFSFKKNLKKEYIKNKIIENGLKEELLFNINQEIENKNQNIYNNILAKNVSIGEVKLLWWSLGEIMSRRSHT